MEYLAKYAQTITLFVYITICILDFIVVPAYIVYTDNIYPQYVTQMHELLKDDPTILREVIAHKPSAWVPFTLRGGGLFHLSFGAILTGSIIGKSRKDK